MKPLASNDDFPVEEVLSHVTLLAEKIGPRGTGTAGEAQAAQYVREQLGPLGCSIEEQRFRAVADMNWFAVSAALFSLLGTVVYPWAGWAHWLATFLAGCAPLLLWWALSHADSPIWFLLPQVHSQNVLARFSSLESVKQRAVVLSHLDSNRCRLAWRAGKTTAIRFGSLATLGVYTLNAVLYVIGAATEFSWPYFASLPGALCGAVTLVILLAELRLPYSAGANDNAAAVAVNLGIAGRLAQDRLRSTEVWLAFTGAEEVDHRGLKRLLQEHEELRDATFIDLEGVGAGELCYLSRQGLLKPYRPDPMLIELAERVAKRRPELKFKAAEMMVVDEVQTLRRLGFRAICLAGRDAATESLPYWHTSADVVENVCAETLAKAAEFVWAMLQELDQGRVG